jgi:hypothetical protein
MSNDAEIYYLRAAEQRQGIELLRRAAVDGIVLQPEQIGVLIPVKR